MCTNGRTGVALKSWLDACVLSLFGRTAVAAGENNIIGAAKMTLGALKDICRNRPPLKCTRKTPLAALGRKYGGDAV